MVDNEYYIWVSATVVKRYGVNAALVLGNIAFFQKASPRPDHMCWRTYRQFAKDTGLNERTVRRTVENLIHGRIIEKVVTGNRGRKTTLYKIIDESVADIYEVSNYLGSDGVRNGSSLQSKAIAANMATTNATSSENAAGQESCGQCGHMSEAKRPDWTHGSGQNGRIDVANLDASHRYSKRSKERYRENYIPPNPPKGGTAAGGQQPKASKRIKSFSDLPTESQEIVRRIVVQLNDSVGSRRRAEETGVWKPVYARLQEGFTEDELTSVINNKLDEWMPSQKMRRYLRPETLFGPKFGSYLSAASMDEAAANDRRCCGYLRRHEGSSNLVINSVEEWNKMVRQERAAKASRDGMG